MHKVFKNKEIKNAGWIIGERVIQMLLSLVVGILSARYLGPKNYGLLNYTASFVTLFTSVATLGMDGVIIKKMIVEPEREGRFLGGCMLLRLISSVLCAATIVTTVWVLDPADDTKVVIALLQSIQLIFQSVHILDSWFQRHLKSKYVSIGKIIAFFMVSIYKILLLATSQSIEWFALSNSLSSIIFVMLLYIFYKQSHGQSLKMDMRSGLFVLKDSYHYILSGVMVSLYSQMDKVMIGWMISDEATGLYTTAISICGMWTFVPMAIINSFRPMILEIHEKGNERLYQLRLRQLYSVIIWMSIGVSIVICLMAPLIVRVLYGEEYIGAVSSLRIVVWSEAFSMIGTARGIWILSEDKNKYVKYYLLIGVVINFILNLVLIQIISIEGAAIATLVTQIATSIGSPMLFKATKAHTAIVLDAFCLRWYFNQKHFRKKW